MCSHDRRARAREFFPVLQQGVGGGRAAGDLQVVCGERSWTVPGLEGLAARQAQAGRGARAAPQARADHVMLDHVMLDHVMLDHVMLVVS